MIDNDNIKIYINLTLNIILFLLFFVPFLLFIFPIIFNYPINVVGKTNLINSHSINKDVYYSYGLAEMQGRRPYMEDRHNVVGTLQGNSSYSFYGIFDGHGGDGASEYCAQKLCKNILKHVQLPNKVNDGLKKGFMVTDSEFINIANKYNKEDGTTALVILVLYKKIYTANVGDCRAILISKNGDWKALSSDHKPNREDEKKRIMDLGGNVIFWGVWRVEGILAVSRAIGDRMIKYLVPADPEITEIDITDDHSYIIMASDGVWDVLSNTEVTDIVLSENDPQKAADLIMNESYRRGSMDNITVIVIDLRKSNFEKDDNDKPNRSLAEESHSINEMDL